MARKTMSWPASQHSQSGRQVVRLTQDQKNRNSGAAQPEALPPARCTEVDKLPARPRKTVERMLIMGSTFEEVVEAINESGEATITLGAIEVYFRSNLKLQQKRIQYQTKTACELKKAFGDPSSAEAEIAQAVIMTGLMGARRGSPAGKLKRETRAKDQNENFRLRELAFRLRTKRFALGMRMMKARLRAEEAKVKLIASKLSQVARDLEQAGGSSTLSPEMILRIQEVYGIASDVPPSKPDGQDRAN
jgi:hypothetical protein